MEGDGAAGSISAGDRISIHALRVEGDRRLAWLGALWKQISIHALRVEGDRGKVDVGTANAISIHALRVEGDLSACRWPLRSRYFYPRPPGGGRQPAINPSLRAKSISIHALRVEGDFRLSAKGGKAAMISIHALRVEGDRASRRFRTALPISIHALRVEGDSKNGQSFHLFLRKREKNLPL